MKYVSVRQFYYETPYRPVTLNDLMVSPQNSRILLNQLITNEIHNAQAGHPAGITLKVKI